MEERQVEMWNDMEIWKKDKLNSEMIWKIQKKIVKWYGKYGWNVQWYEQYGAKVSWIVKRYGKCRRKVGWIVKWYEK